MGPGGEWSAFGTYIYGKNGFAIHGAECLEVLHLVRAMEILGMKP